MNETLTIATGIITTTLPPTDHPELMWPMFGVMAGLGLLIIGWGLVLWIKRRQKKEREQGKK